MFKKKPKRDQRVLLADQQHSPPNNNKQQPELKPINPLSEPNNHNHPSEPTDKREGNQVSKQGFIPNQRKTNGIAQDLTDGLKRSKNQQEVYMQDVQQNLENQPKKGLKPNKNKGTFVISTQGKKEETERQVRDAFQGISHRAGANLIKDMNLPEDQLEEETAKRKYLENVEKTKMIKEGKLNTKIYRGMNAYANHKLTNNDIENAAEAYKKVMGPSRLNSTIKNTCRFDYVQNLCKDWHDSGYCPFGNSCLYLHDRSNVKTGWELEKDFQQQERERWKRINNPQLAKKEDRQKLLKTIEKYLPPQKCESCQKRLQNAVQVECGHIFCSGCATKMLKCRICNKRLGGIMNNADEKIKKMAKDYEEMLAKLESEQEELQTKRRKFEHINTLDVFAD